jgi:hypothetical protein
MRIKDNVNYLFLSKDTHLQPEFIDIVGVV